MMSGIFTRLQDEHARQQAVIHAPEVKVTQKDAQKVEQDVAQKDAQSMAQKVEQDVAQKGERMSKGVSLPVSAEQVEELNFQLRKSHKVKVNTTIPESWKEELDEVTHQLGVGKYELVMYAIGAFLGKIEHQ